LALIVDASMDLDDDRVAALFDVSFHALSLSP
jgi:hypothetical protein